MQDWRTLNRKNIRTTSGVSVLSWSNKKMNSPTAYEPLPLFSPECDGRDILRINNTVYLETTDGFCVVWVGFSAWHRFAATNKLDRRIVGANLVLAGLAKPLEVVRGLGINRDTLHKDRKRIMEGGIQAMASVRLGPKGPSKAGPELQARARRFYEQGVSNTEIGRRLGVTEGTIRRILANQPPRGPLATQPSLPEADRASSEKVEVSTETNDSIATVETSVDESELEVTSTTEDASAFVSPFPHRDKTTERDLDRTAERVLARFGKISEAEIRYVAGDNLRFVGALLIIPALVETGFFAGVENVYGGLRNGFYGLRHTVMTIALMLILRINRAEHLARVSPTALGRLLGIDRAPEVKTLRRRLHEIAGLGKADEFMRWFATHLAEKDADVLGMLYVDGHTRIYYGQRNVSKAYSTRKRLALPAVTDFWVHDMNGQPVFVVTGEVNQSLTKQLLPLVEELKELLSPEKRLTFVFDRGGWSPKLFKALVDAGCDFITYRKGKCPHYHLKDFTEHTFETGDRKASYLLRDGFARFGVGMQFRQIVRRDNEGKQIAIVTSRDDLAAAEVVFRIGDRWRQENYFKYLLSEFDLDALDTYDVTPEDSQRTVPNPKRKPFDKRIRILRKAIQELEAELGRAADTNEESCRPTVRGFKIANGQLRQELAKKREEVERLVERRKKLPSRVTIGEATSDEAVLLEVEHKHFMNIVKMAVYRAESSLLQLLAPYYVRSAEEGRALLQEAFTSSGSLRLENGELHVTLSPMSAPRRTVAIAALCEQLNSGHVRVPGTTLRLHFSVSRETGVSELAMGPCQEV